MAESIEERLQDLEQLVLRQSERIAALEERLDTATQIAIARVKRSLAKPESEAA